MIFTETKLKGVYVIDIERRTDSRGFFSRAWCENELNVHGIPTRFVQSNIGFSHAKGTLRGMHFQTAPFQEVKLVRCTMGRVVDVAIDLRPESATYREWISEELSSDNRKMLLIPEGCAHGYMTLVDNTELLYETSQFYAAAHATGVLYNDPAFGVVWPAPVCVISDADMNWPQFTPSNK